MSFLLGMKMGAGLRNARRGEVSTDLRTGLEMRSMTAMAGLHVLL